MSKKHRQKNWQKYEIRQENEIQYFQSKYNNEILNNN